MRFVAVLATALVAASPAASAPSGHGPKGSACRATVSYILRGPLASVAADSLTMDVSGANRHAAPSAGLTLAIGVSAQTKIVRDDAKVPLSALVPGDLLNVQVRSCRGADPASTALVAQRVTAASVPPSLP